MHCSPPRTRRIAGYRLKYAIDSTNNSLVYIAESIKSLEDVILKLIPLNSSQTSKESAQRECDIQTKLSHPYIMHIEEVKEEKDLKIIVMKWAKTGTIEEIYQNIKQSKCQFASLIQTAKIMFRILLAIEYLHKSLILHGDIKPRNIVLTNTDDDPIPQIIDFGFARKIEQSELCHCTKLSPIYAAPEQLLQEGHSFAADIYSVGATFKYMVTGEHPLKNEAEYQIMAKKIHNISFADIENQSLRSLIRGMMNPFPEKRLDIVSCIHSDFFVEVLGREWIENEIRTARMQTEPFVNNVFINCEWCQY